MTTDPEHELDQHLRAIAHALVAEAPDAPDSILDAGSNLPATTARRRPALMVAASIVVIGGGGLLGLQLANREPSTGVGDTTADAAGQPTTAPPTTTVGTEDGEHGMVRLVLPGDSLASIAEASCLTPEEIAEYNEWPDGIEHPLYPNDIIDIPPGACGELAPTIAPSTTSVETSPTEQEYVVQTGDYLAGIAEEFGVSIDDLVEYNQWPDGANQALFVGDVVRIPPGAVDHASGETLPATLGLLGGPLLRCLRRVRAR